MKRDNEVPADTDKYSKIQTSGKRSGPFAGPFAYVQSELTDDGRVWGSLFQIDGQHTGLQVKVLIPHS